MPRSSQIFGDLERRIQDLLAAHPYLIAPRLKGLKPEKEASLDKRRADLLFETRRGLCIVEIKRGPLTLADVEQLTNYCATWESEKRLANEHFLVGKVPRNPAKFQSALDDCGFTIRALFLGRDIPTKLVFDKDRDEYVAFHVEMEIGGRFVLPVIELRV